MTDAERSAIVNTTLEQTAGRLPVCVTVSAPSTFRAEGYARQAEAAGAHSVMLSAPPLARPNDDAVRRHYLRVAEAVPELPVVIQDLPALGVWMSAELIARMASEAPNLRVVKLEEEPTAPKVGRLLAANPELRVLGGLGGEMLDRGAAARRGRHDDRLWLSGDARGDHARLARRGRGSRREAVPRVDAADPVREPAAAQPAHPQAHLHASRRHGVATRCARPGRCSTSRRRPIWTTC